MPDIGQRRLGGDDTLKALIVTGPGGDWWPTTLEPMVREMYDQRVATAATASERH
jgi:hypothetical protein